MYKIILVKHLYNVNISHSETTLFQLKIWVKYNYKIEDMLDEKINKKQTQVYNLIEKIV